MSFQRLVPGSTSIDLPVKFNSFSKELKILSETVRNYYWVLFFSLNITLRSNGIVLLQLLDKYKGQLAADSQHGKSQHKLFALE